jgi:hypothetical protein
MSKNASVRAKYRQDPSLGSERFILDDDQLIIATDALGLKSEKIIELDDIDPTPVLCSRRFWHLVFLPGFLSIVMAIATWRLGILATYTSLLSLLTGVFAALFVFYTVKGAHRIKVWRFRNHQGDELFQIFAPRRLIEMDARARALGRQKETQTAEFLDDLSKRIRSANERHV